MFPILVYTTLRSCFSSGFVYFSFADSGSNDSPFCVRSCLPIVCDSLLISLIEELRFFMDFILCLVYSSSVLLLLILLLYLYLVVIWMILGMKVKRAISRVSMVYCILCLFD